MRTKVLLAVILMAVVSAALAVCINFHAKGQSVLSLNVEALAEGEGVWVQEKFSCWSAITHKKDNEVRKCSGCVLVPDSCPTIPEHVKVCYTYVWKPLN